MAARMPDEGRVTVSLRKSTKSGGLMLTRVFPMAAEGFKCSGTPPRTRVRNPNIPVIALTAHALATDRTRCLAAGMNDYLTKPINPIALQQALSRALPAAARR